MSEKHTLSAYEVEDQQLADSILKFNYYERWAKGEGDLELFVTLDNGGEKTFKDYFDIKESIYPKEIRDAEKISNNIKKLLNWYVKNNFQCDISLFGDGWVDTLLFKDVLTEIYNSFDGSLFVPKHLYIDIPVDYFGLSDNIDYLSDIYQTFKANLSIEVICRIHAIGGAIHALPSDVYRSMFLFTVHHPSSVIVSTIYQQDMELWVENADWWSTVPAGIFEKVKFEVETSNKWTEQDLLNYQSVLNILSGKAASASGIEKDDSEGLQRLFISPTNNKTNSITQLGINNFTIGKDLVQYGITDSFCIRCGDLAVPISRGLSYEDLLIGKYGTDGTSITEFISIKSERFIPKIYTKLSCIPHCEACPYVGVCKGFDPAVAFQIYLNPFIAVRKHCDLQKVYFDYMLLNLKKLGALDDIKAIGLSESEKQYFEDLIKYVEVVNEAK